MNFLVFLTVFSFFPAADSEGPPATSLPDPEHQLYSKRMLGWKICLEFVHLYSCVGWITAKLENVNSGDPSRGHKDHLLWEFRRSRLGAFPWSSSHCMNQERTGGGAGVCYEDVFYKLFSILAHQQDHKIRHFL